LSLPRRRRQVGRHGHAHEHPGYDIESLDEFGEVARYIEVKSSEDEWGKRGVGLSDTQFKKAQELGSRFWLYVVESAVSDNPQIHCIQDPANRVNLFLYDSGWRAVALLQDKLRASEPVRKVRPGDLHPRPEKTMRKRVLSERPMVAETQSIWPAWRSRMRPL